MLGYLLKKSEKSLLYSIAVPVISILLDVSDTCLFVAPILVFGSHYIYDSYKENIYEFATDVKNKMHSHISGVSSYNRHQEQVFRELDNEYGYKINDFSSSTCISEGIFHNDKLSGLGRIICTSGHTSMNAKGIFKNNKLHGLGTLRIKDEFLDTCAVYQGMFKNSALHGDATVDTPNVTITGTFKRGKLMNGKIVVKQYNKRVMHTSYHSIKELRGNFGYNTIETINTAYIPFYKLNGHGAIEYTTFTETGTFRSGRLSGYGVRNYFNGNVKHKGMFKNGLLHGTAEIIKKDFTIKSVFNNGRIVNSYSIIFDNETVLSYSPTDKQLSIAFQNSDTLNATYTGHMLNKPLYQSFTGLFERLLNKDELANSSYNIMDSIENMDKQQFMFWIMSLDKELFEFLKNSNLYNFIDGKLYTSIETPEDFDLPEINSNVLNRLISLKHQQAPSVDDGMVMITTKIIK